MKQQSLRPADVVVAFQMAISPHARLTVLADRSGRSLGEVHNAITRLRSAGLVDPETRRVEREPFLQFVRWGVPYAFPPAIGGATVGLATAVLNTAPEKSTESPERVEFVWAAAEGTSRGMALEPLHPRVPEVAGRNTTLYALLSAVDLIRVGGARERAAASAQIERLLAVEALHG